jgi:tetratricopeptide (TPR) repeat protein
MVEGKVLVDSVDDPDSLAIVYRAMSIAARNAATVDESIEYARMGADRAQDETIRRECLLTLAGSVADRSGSAPALAILNEASEGADGLIAGQLQFQRGVVLASAGEYEHAIAAFGKALPVFERHDRVDFVAMTLHNQGYIHTQTGHLVDAESALRRARDIEESLGRHMEVSGTDNNLGILASYRGDIPEALRRLAMSDESKTRHAGSETPHHVTRCEVLISAGLFSEALALAKQIAGAAKQEGRGEDETDAILVAARAAVLAGRLDDAVKLGGLASRQFHRQGRDAWAIQADLVLAEAVYQDSGASIELAATARRVAEDLGNAGFVVAAARARLLAGRISLDLGDFESANFEFEHLGLSDSGPVELRVGRWQAKAMIRQARNDTRGAAAAAKAGLRLLDDYQAGLGATDLRWAIERQGRDLGEIGMRLAVESARPRRVFSWMELTRARALRHPPVVPEADEKAASLLAELRRVGAELRDPEQQIDSRLIRRQRRLQEELRSRNRLHNQPDSHLGRLSPEVLATDLGGRTLVELGSVDGELMAITVGGGRFSMRSLGSAAVVETALKRLRFDLRRTARLRRDLAGVVEGLARFDRLLLGKLGELKGNVVLVPSPSLIAAPWAVMPSLSEVTLTVAPSAEIWWRGQHRKPSGSGVVLALGPDLENAENEVEAIARVYPDAVKLGLDDSALEFGDAVRGAAVAHVACHAVFQAENPMFSSLRLPDGDFSVYDLERIGDPPDLMVLSACDSGYTEAAAGDELTGLTSALLSMGSRSVVASVGLVPDSGATADLMTRFHIGVASGQGASAALAAAADQVASDPAGYLAAASFIAVGAG